MADVAGKHGVAFQATDACPTELELYDEGSTVVIALVAVDRSKRWEQPLELPELDKVISSLRALRREVMRKVYGTQARGVRGGKR